MTMLPRLVGATTADVVVPATVPLAAESPFRRLFAAVRATARRARRFRPRCLLLGHEDSFGRRPDRLTLRCATCGRETVGWPIGPGPADGVVTRQPAPARRPPALEPATRAGVWTPRRWARRGEAREQQRQRLVAAAARAAEQRSKESDAHRPSDQRAVTRPPIGEAPADRWMDVARRVRAGLGG
jgi:hypothetical protein